MLNTTFCNLRFILNTSQIFFLALLSSVNYGKVSLKPIKFKRPLSEYDIIIDDTFYYFF